jgi:hypothetical protein
MSSALPQGTPTNQRPHAPTRGDSDSSADERREHLRRMLRVPACLDAPGAHNPIQLIDICRAGVAFASKPPLALGSILKVSFELPTAPGILNTVSGDVVYCKLMAQSNLFKIGARLHPMDQAIVERIVDFVTAAYIP